MPTPLKEEGGRGRIDYKGDKAFVDAVVHAAKNTTGNLSAYVKLALTERMERDGFPVPRSPAPEPVEEKPKRPRGRPKKGTA